MTLRLKTSVQTELAAKVSPEEGERSGLRRLRLGQIKLKGRVAQRLAALREQGSGFDAQHHHERETKNYSKSDSSQINPSKRWGGRVKSWGAAEAVSKEQVGADDAGSPCRTGSAAGPA